MKIEKTIAIYNFKGGVGKTTSAYNLACGWSKKYKVLVIDCDPQCNLTNTILPNHKGKNSVYAYLREFVHNSIPSIEPIKINSKLHIIPGHYNMIDLESNNQFIEFGTIMMQRFLKQIKADYDIVLLDCPSYFGKTVKSVIANVDGLLIPATPDIFALKGAMKLMKHIKELKRSQKLNVFGIFLNRFKKDLIYHRKIRVVAKRIFGSLILPQIIRNSVRIGETTDPRFVRDEDDNPQNDVVNDFLALGEMIIRKTAPQDIENFTLPTLVKTSASQDSKRPTHPGINRFRESLQSFGVSSA